MAQELDTTYKVVRREGWWSVYRFLGVERQTQMYSTMYKIKAVAVAEYLAERESICSYCHGNAYLERTPCPKCGRNKLVVAA